MWQNIKTARSTATISILLEAMVHAISRLYNSVWQFAINILYIIYASKTTSTRSSVTLKNVQQRVI